MSTPEEFTPSAEDMTSWVHTSKGYFPGDRVIIVEGANRPEIVAFIRDVEADTVKISFSRDGTFNIVTKNLTYLMFDAQVIEQLADLCEEAEEVYDDIEVFLDEDGDYEIPDALIVKPVQSAEMDAIRRSINAVLGMAPLEI